MNQDLKRANLKRGDVINSLKQAGGSILGSRRVIPERREFEAPSADLLSYRSLHAPDPDMIDGKGKPIPVVEKPNPRDFVLASDDTYGRPYRTVDTLAIMERRGAIKRWHAEAGRRFQADFERASLDQLRAGDLQRGGMGKGGAAAGEPELTEVMVQARRDVDRAMRVLGGRESPAGSVVWGVLGEGLNIDAYAKRTIFGTGRSMRRDVAREVLIGALWALASHYGC